MKPKPIAMFYGSEVRDTSRVTELEKERDQLKAWKESAMAVEAEWDCQKVAKLLNLPLGSSVRAGIEPAIRALLEDNRRLRELLRSAPLGHRRNCICCFCESIRKALAATVQEGEQP